MIENYEQLERYVREVEFRLMQLHLDHIDVTILLPRRTWSGLMPHHNWAQDNGHRQSMRMGVHLCVSWAPDMEDEDPARLSFEAGDLFDVNRINGEINLR